MRLNYSKFNTLQDITRKERRKENSSVYSIKSHFTYLFFLKKDLIVLKRIQNLESKCIYLLILFYNKTFFIHI